MNPTSYPPYRRRRGQRSHRSDPNKTTIDPPHLYTRPGAPGKLWEPSRAPDYRRAPKIPPATQTTLQPQQLQLQKPIRQPLSPPVDHQQYQYFRQRRQPLPTSRDPKSSIDNHQAPPALQQLKSSPAKTPHPQSQEPNYILPRPEFQQSKHTINISEDEHKLITTARTARMSSILTDWEITWDNASAKNTPHELPGYILNLDGMALSEWPTPVTLLTQDQRVITKPEESKHSPHTKTSSPAYKPSPSATNAAYQSPGSIKAIEPQQSSSPTAPPSNKATPAAITDKSTRDSMMVIPSNELPRAKSLMEYSVCQKELGPFTPVVPHPDEEDEEFTRPPPTAALQFSQLKAKIPWLSKQRTISGAGWRPFEEYYWGNFNSDAEQGGNQNTLGNLEEPAIKET